MTDSIIAVAVMAVGVILVVVAVVMATAPATGRHRARVTSRATPLRACVRRPAAPRTALPARRSPYGIEGPLEGERVALIRPYLDPGPVRGVYAYPGCAPHYPPRPDASGSFREGRA